VSVYSGPSMGRVGVNCSAGMGRVGINCPSSVRAMGIVGVAAYTGVSCGAANPGGPAVAGV
jgi:hypothetical protein